MASKEIVDFWNDFSWWMSEDSFIGWQWSSQNILWVDTQRFPKWVKLSSAVKNVHSNIWNSVNFFFDLNAYWSNKVLSFVDNAKIYDSQYWLVYTSPTSKKYYTAWALKVAWSLQLYYIGSGWNISKNLMSDVISWTWTAANVDWLTTYTNGSWTQRPILNDNANYFYFGNWANLLYKFDNLEQLTLVSTLREDENIVGITRIWDLIRIYTTTWVSPSFANGRMYYYSAATLASATGSTPAPYLWYVDWTWLPIRWVVNMWQYDYVIAGINDSYSALYYAQWLDYQLVYSAWDANAYDWLDFQLDINALSNRKNIAYMVAYNDVSNKHWIVTLWKQLSINKPALNFEFYDPIISSISAVKCVWGQRTYIHYVASGQDNVWYFEHNNPPTWNAWYVSVWEIWSRRIDFGDISLKKQIKEINIMYDLDLNGNIWGSLDVYVRCKGSDSWTLIANITNTTEKRHRITANELNSKWLDYFYYIEYRVVINAWWLSSWIYTQSPIFYWIKTDLNINIQW